MSVSNAGPGETAASSETRPLMRLDRFAQMLGHEQIDVLKIDVEGLESAVLEGAKELPGRQAIRTLVIGADAHGRRYGVSDDKVPGLLATLRLSSGSDDSEFSVHGLEGGNWPVLQRSDLCVS